MNATVVDCSALAAVVFEEDWGAEVVPQLTGRRLIAPALLPFELAQVCSTVCGLLAENVSLHFARLPCQIAFRAHTSAISGMARKSRPCTRRSYTQIIDSGWKHQALAHSGALVSMRARAAPAGQAPKRPHDPIQGPLHAGVLVGLGEVRVVDAPHGDRLRLGVVAAERRHAEPRQRNGVRKAATRNFFD
jgi:hypothetical protein